MVINERLRKNLRDLQNNVEKIVCGTAITDFQIENFLKSFEKARYNILSEIKIYNKNVEYEHEKIKTIEQEKQKQLH